jgi:transposase
MVLVNKFLLHQPLNRQSKTYAREGIEIDVSTLADRLRNPDQLRRSHVALPAPDGVKSAETLIAAE